MSPTRSGRAPRLASAPRDWPRLQSQQTKKRIDAAIHQAYGRLAEPEVRASFTALLLVVRQRSNLFSPLRDRRAGTPQVEALVNLARFMHRAVHGVEDWPGAHGSTHEVIASLAEHLFSDYAVPRFLSSVWYGDGSSHAERKRRWYVEYARGARFRDLVRGWFPITRCMQHHFLCSPDHLGLERALRRAELLALGAEAELVDAVAATRLGDRLVECGFWRTVMRWFVRVQSDLPLTQVGPIIDFIQAMRFTVTEVDHEGQQLTFGPPQPEWSIKGRSPASLLRQVQHWHGTLQYSGRPHLSWSCSGLDAMTLDAKVVEDELVVWELVELTTSAELLREGKALQHCVASYVRDCRRDESRIWSLRRRGESTLHSLVTVEVDPRRRMIVQARGLRNRPVRGRERTWIERWAERERLKIAL